MENSIEIKHLLKKYDHFQLNNINLHIPSGSIVGLIGENGAGKTTLLKSILNIINIDKGSITIFGKDWKLAEQMVKEDIGVVLDNSFFPELLKPKDIRDIMRHIYRTWDDALFQQYMEEFSLPNQTIKTMSKGMRKKLEIAVALSHHPKLLILDEPTSGLDPVVRAEILDIFLDFIQDEEHTIILSTHITSDLEHIADYIVFIDHGKIVFNQSKDDILEQYGVIKCGEDMFQTLSKEEIIRYRKNRYHYEILVNNRKHFQKKYPDVCIDKVTLEDIMVLYIKGVK